MMKNHFARMMLLLAGAMFPALSHADSIGMSSQNGTNYTYDFYSPSGTINFAAGSTMTLTGLSDVTGVTLGQYAGYYGTVTWDGTSVTYTLSQDANYSGSSPVDLQLFTVSSSDSNMGELTYALQENSGTQTGTIAATNNATTPEPGTLLLMATGAAVLFGVVRRQRAGAAAGAGLRPAI